MSGYWIFNTLLGIGYAFQAAIVFWFLLEVKKAKPLKYAAILSKKGLFSELLLVVAAISVTVSVQNLVNSSHSIDNALFVWRILLNFWCCGIWIRWTWFTRKINKSNRYD